MTSHDVVARGAPRAAACARSATPGRSTRSRPGCCSSWSGARDASAALPHGAAEDATWRSRGSARVSTHRRPRRRAHRDRARARRTRSSCRPARSASARRPTPRSRSTASAPTSARARGEEVEMPEREVEVYALRAARGARATAPRFEIECSSGTYVRTPDRRPRRRLLRGAAAHGDRPVRRRGRRRRARRSRSATRSAFLPRARARRGDAGGARRRGHGRRAIRPRLRLPSGREVLLLDDGRADRARRAARRTACSSPS